MVLLSQCLLLLLIFFFKGCNNTNTSHEQPCYCHDEESSALLQFKQSFTINASASGLEGAYPKVSSWKPAQGGNNTCCCAWDGVECDEEMGHVIGLNLSSSCLYGSINSNSSLFRLVHLQRLNLADNDFNYSQIPITIRNFPSLTHLDLSASVFSGRVPSQLSQLVKLSTLDLSLNVGPSAERLLKLDGSNFRSLVQNLTSLQKLSLSYINISSPVPNSMANLSFLTSLFLGECGIFGPFPVSFSNLTNLEILHLKNNELSGIVEFQMFQKLQNLKDLQLSYNKLEFVSESTDMNASTIPQFTYLTLRGCNIREFPYFLRYQKSLERLDLLGNKLHGKVPKWMYNVSTETMKYLSLESNLLSGFDQLPVVLPWVNLQYFSLSNNTFQGPLPVPAGSTSGVYQVQGNNFTGEISPLICNINSLQALVLSDNNLSGMIPQCFRNLTSLRSLELSNNNLIGLIPQFFGNFSDNLMLLHVGNNFFHGALQQTYSNKSNLKMLDVSQNELQGQLPRSLANCLMLVTLILSDNNFNDVFPSWLRTLPDLKLLAMRHNGFRGVIRKPENNQVRFPKLRVLDLSYNNFTGEFLAEYILTEYAMRSNISNQLTYMSAAIDFTSVSGIQWIDYGSRITITSKGVDRYYSKIQEAFAVIDISSNNFVGKIDEWIGNLKGLWSLNVSNNLLTGGIPSSLGNLTHLESLDLSNNKLSGEIPQQLSQLTFLAEFNVSHNNLTGPIPRGTQLTGFNVTSYEGNSGLCGDPLPKKCGNSNTSAPPPPSRTEENDSGSGLHEFDWIFVLAGVGSGLVVGVVLADVAITRRRELFLEIVEILIDLMESITSWKRFGRRN